MIIKIHPSWQSVLASEFEQPYWNILTDFIKREYSQKICFPQEQNIFRAFDMTPFDAVKVVILGQDPYHTAGAAMGLSFSIPNPPNPLRHNSLLEVQTQNLSQGRTRKTQPSLRNIFKELESDLGVTRTKTDLTDWAEQGVLLLNSVLTVRQGEPASHSGKGWENFTDAAIETLSQKREGILFILWGNYAIAKKSLIDASKHHIIESPHPSPFSAHRGFCGSRPFSQTNAYLREQGSTEIVWG